MSESLAKATCRIHFERPASARCPSCHQFYCAECITEHDGRLTCASCLNEAREEAAAPKRSRSWTGWLQPMPVIQLVVAVVVVWIIFYLLAQTLTDIPDRFHDGTIWE